MASLGNDLANIRKEKNISLSDIHEATKIPKHILSSIEDDSIFSDFEENPTYIRSYVRSYAKALSIDEQKIVYALNKKEKGNYQGSLLQKRKTEPEESFEYDEEDHSEITKEDDQIPKDDNSEIRQPDPREDTPPKPSTLVTDSPSVRSVDWADLGRRFQPLESTKSKVWIGIFTIVLVTALGTYVYFYESDSTDTNNAQNSPQNEQTASSNIISDSLQLNISPTEEEDTTELNANTQQVADIGNESLEALPDTLNIVLYAAYGKLEPVRVYTDIMDGINPYWIEEGEAIRFNFVNEIRIRGQYSRMVLLMNGHIIQNIRAEFYNPDTRLLEIERSYFEEDSTWLEPAPDSLNIDAPPPSEIRSRPTFN